MPDDTATDYRPTRAEIDLSAITANVDTIHSTALVPLWAVIKADAYGHGAVEVGRALAGHAGVRGLAVSLVEEAVTLRDAGIGGPILVMGPALCGGEREAVALGLSMLVSSLADVRALADAADAAETAVDIHIKIDTGMGRLGFLPAELDEVLALARTRKSLSVSAIATHFASADSDAPDDGDSQTRAQLTRFAVAAAQAKRAGFVGERHAANSAAMWRFPASRYDVIRPGLALYGNGLADANLAHAMRLRTEIAKLRSVPKGTQVSYGALWTAPRDSVLAVLPLGYADGLPRNMSGAAGAPRAALPQVLIGGMRHPIVGAICMDMAVVDVTDTAPSRAVGDEVVVLGGQEGDHITAAEFAANAGITEYEVTCGVSRRVPRIYP